MGPLLAEEAIRWTDTVTALATAATALAVIVAIWAIYDGKYSNANNWILELDRDFLSHPELTARFFDPAEAFDPHDAEMRSFIELVYDTWDFFLRHRFGVGKPAKRFLFEIRRRNALFDLSAETIDGLQVSWQAAAFALFDRSPMLRGYIDTNSDQFTEQESAMFRVYRFYKERKAVPKPGE